MTDIILASASPRRAELLDQIGIKYQVQAVDIDESSKQNESATDLVTRLAKEKSQAITGQNLPVLGSDTLGVIDDELLVKPVDLTHAIKMLSKMSGRWHQILSAVAITHNNNTKVLISNNRVLFRRISEAEICAYWHTGEPQDKAGAYAIQGLGASFIQKIEGSYSGIMGLPLFETTNLLEQVGVSVLAKYNNEPEKEKT